MMNTSTAFVVWLYVWEVTRCADCAGRAECGLSWGSASVCGMDHRPHRYDYEGYGMRELAR